MMATKHVAIVGAGLMTQPLVDYFIERSGYQVTLANRTVSKAREIIAGRSQGKAVRWSVDEPELLDKVISEADIVVSMVPKPVHTHVAIPCLRHRKSMVTTSYEIPELIALDKEARQRGILILNETGESPGLDHMGTQMLLADIRKDAGRVISINSYGCGLPAFEFNRNPMGYTFSWDPRTVFVSAQTPATYLKSGKRIDVPGDRLFEHFWLVDIEGLGTFETYPNRDCTRYVKPFGLEDDVSFYRGLLRFSGYCNNMQYMLAMGLLDSEEEEDFEGKTYRQFTASLVGSESVENLEGAVARYLKIDDHADIIHRLGWLGLFDDRQVVVKKGTRLDVLLDRMLEKMSYEPHERDMTIVHIEILAEFGEGRREKRLATLYLEGSPGLGSAMSRSVALPAAIATRAIVEGKINATGVQIPPTLPSLYILVLEELKAFGFDFEQETISQMECRERRFLGVR
ncbi:saccharopine dehydrogenase C-terminal domain-containing protein [Candidatus Eisenbacteria bacterium]|uniref:Saccharopine dehydrogenase C-terminal domain-containing protein n=1 Tax=Eiseniibacteriota bacterium TaxID=2212470 RepID=A0ABV6YJR4_UNCEI